MNATAMALLLVGLVASAAAVAMIQNLLKAAVALAAVSALLAVMMFLLGAPLAAVFELSVCAGLITVVFVSAISMTRVRTAEEEDMATHARRSRFRYLPALLIAVGAALLALAWPHLTTLMPQVAPPSAETVEHVLWGSRKLDLLAQIAIILAGVFGVLVFFRKGDAK
ncbi:MAG: hypothetical protein GX558_09180 [Clostridiales bacterium]|nr:hypothetical protein [Clostridiales bacterium]